MDEIAEVLSGLGPRLRRLRSEAGASLEEVASRTGISVSTLSRLETGRRRPTLELLLLLAAEHSLSLDELVGAPETGDPRTRLRARTRHGRTYLPLSRRPGGVQAFKLVLPTGESSGPNRLNVHSGHQWLAVLSGRVTVRVGTRTVDLGPGEAVEFDTRLPHVVANPGDVPCEVLALFGPQGERIRMRAPS